jgi:autoinducer 2 (AI-2) kinase
MTWTSIKAAITGRTFIIPECSEAACLGAAFVAAAGAGLFSNYEAAGKDWINYQSTFEPQTAERDQYLKQESP